MFWLVSFNTYKPKHQPFSLLLIIKTGKVFHKSDL